MARCGALGRPVDASGCPVITSNRVLLHKAIFILATVFCLPAPGVLFFLPGLFVPLLLLPPTIKREREVSPMTLFSSHSSYPSPLHNLKLSIADSAPREGRLCLQPSPSFLMGHHSFLDPCCCKVGVFYCIMMFFLSLHAYSLHIYFVECVSLCL